MPKQFKVIHSNAAGADIGSEKIFIAVDGEPVQSFLTFTETLEDAVAFLKKQKVTSIAMEATGVYWITFYDMVEQAGIEAWLVNPKQTKNLPGRKSDVQDCQWIQQLHSYGLLSRSFVPDGIIRELRDYVRLREDHIRQKATHVQHMQKALTQMNIRLHQVISQIQGKSGRNVIDAILEGERDPEKLSALCDKQILKNKKQEVIASLKGNYKKQHLFALSQAVEAFDFYQDQIEACDQKIAAVLEQLSKDKATPKQITKAKPIRHNKPLIEDLHKEILTITEGKDMSVLPGITDYSIIQLLGELGTDLRRWPTEKHFTSYLRLAPGKNQSGKINKRSKQKGTTPAGQIFKESAHSLLKSKNNALGAFGRRIRAKKGPAIAIKAVARKLAVMYYWLFTEGIEYVEDGAKKYEERQNENLRRFVMKKAKELGLEIAGNQPIDASVHW